MYLFGLIFGINVFVVVVGMVVGLMVGGVIVMGLGWFWFFFVNFFFGMLVIGLVWCNLLFDYEIGGVFDVRGVVLLIIVLVVFVMVVD